MWCCGHGRTHGLAVGAWADPGGVDVGGSHHLRGSGGAGEPG
jgi:hypothetical protein